jgi:hypothetical protein
MTMKEGEKEGNIRRYAFICKARDLTSRLEEEIKKGELLKALRIYN